MNSTRQLAQRRVSLIPLESSHTKGLLACARHPEVWNYYPFKLESEEDVAAYVSKAIAAREQGEELPYVVWDHVLQQIVGCTRLLRISPKNRSLNIGSTWYMPKVWRTRVNTECKYMLLQYAFEEWGAVRVELVTTPDNLRSQRAIERLGAACEGLSRKRYNQRDYIVYSIIDDQWSSVKERLEGFLLP
ncbi:RimJ/RimL family protein N-acetyltransferase [Paenibacillus phyllosphaerae]|uniref:RimJ/RimL family protein N-acetyltransferase n=1 Tax=Paenibacillus phyllosphaerae TaxID=274593 RepID=A0A7W5B613_9BACL|nr:GNAT family N-acetyltransferase [Paenibacillus phyllosphaerae]MBB3114601.1 RimJ/RimL family protein N-acetyltransferase [Paenibacillus phyllosphaerae]